MNTIYCKNCENIVGQWNNTFYFYGCSGFCGFTQSKKNEFVYFLDCLNCKKFIGILCWYVCTTCFGEDVIFGEENLFIFFLKHKKITKFDHFCDICKNKKFRNQFWFFKELTFYK